ncbi:PIN domain-containing protein [Maioricimonas sp. JC845]|uniref:PIN domain-containing protein n=1 Tax=Maioricimonas sp. JC845 TaxID=3232138 RepID=UPI0034597FE9
MRARFPEYFDLSQEQFDKLWRTAKFAFDANVLLNLYRYSNDTRESFLAIMREHRDRLWIPHHAALEFLRQRPTVIAGQAKKYEQLRKDIAQIRKTLETDRQHPFLSDESQDALFGVFEKVQDELQDREEKLYSRLRDDPILMEVAKLLDDRVGEAFEDETVGQHLSEGQRRCEEEVPPGYKDASKEENAFGDYFVWRQILDFSSAKGVSIVFVTADRKEDWWRVVHGETLGPRVELRREFRSVCGEQLFHMYTPELFLRYANQHLSAAVDETSIEEVRFLQEESFRRAAAMSQQRGENESVRSQLLEYASGEQGELDALRQELMSRRHRLAAEIDMQRQRLDLLCRLYGESDDIDSKKAIAEEREQLERQLLTLYETVERIDFDLRDLEGRCRDHVKSRRDWMRRRRNRPGAQRSE